MEQRVYGLENEYAIIYEPADGESAAPSPRSVYSILESYVRETYPTLPARGVKGGIFLSNGALLHYEARMERYDEGLAELNTPECATPRELCVYHFAMDRILIDALPQVRQALAAQGFSGRLSFAKANVDRYNRTFGATENYLVDDPLPWPLRPLQIPGQILLSVLTLLAHGLAMLPIGVGVALLALLLIVGIARLPLMLVATLIPGMRARFRRIASWDGMSERVMALLDSDRALAALGAWTSVVFFPVVVLYSSFARVFYLRRFRRWLVPFMVTRTAFAGNGRVDFSKGQRFFRLSSRADNIRTGFKVFWNDKRKPIIDIKHLLLDLREPWRRRKRLSLLYSDGHLCDDALFLSTAVTALVLEAIERNAFRKSPEVRLARPIATLHALNGDPRSANRFSLANGERLSPLEHQRRYLEIVRKVVMGEPIINLHKLRVLRAWEETIASLEESPDALDGRVDWVTKRVLLEEVAGGPAGLAEIGRWAYALQVLDRASVDDADLTLDGSRFWARLAEKMHPADRRQLQAELARQDLDPDELPWAARMGYALRKVDLKYHDLDPEAGYAQLLRSEGALARVASDEDLAHAQENPPTSTRAYARGEAIARASRAGHRGKAGWRSVVDYDTKESLHLPDPLSPVPGRSENTDKTV